MSVSQKTSMSLVRTIISDASDQMFSTPKYFTTFSLSPRASSGSTCRECYMVWLLPPRHTLQLHIFKLWFVHMFRVGTPVSWRRHCPTFWPLGRSKRVQTVVTISEVHHMPPVCRPGRNKANLGCACVWRHLRHWTWHTPCVGMSCLAVGRTMR